MRWFDSLDDTFVMTTILRNYYHNRWIFSQFFFIHFHSVVLSSFLIYFSLFFFTWCSIFCSFKPFSLLVPLPPPLSLILITYLIFRPSFFTHFPIPFKHFFLQFQAIFTSRSSSSSGNNSSGVGYTLSSTLASCFDDLAVWNSCAGAGKNV